jgi:hypothetical protein
VQSNASILVTGVARIVAFTRELWFFHEKLGEVGIERNRTGLQLATKVDKKLQKATDCDNQRLPRW